MESENNLNYTNDSSSELLVKSPSLAKKLKTLPTNLTTATTLTYQNSKFQRTHFRVSMQDFLSGTSEQERSALRLALDQTIAAALLAGRHVLLEGLGIILVSEEEQSKAYQVGEFTALRIERTRKLDFEKCAHFEKADDLLFPNIVKTAELAKSCQIRLPAILSLKWPEDDLKKLIRALLRLIKSGLVINGFSKAFPQVGTFLALHNRQGHSETDWFAGADIFLSGMLNKTVSISKPTWHERPILNDALELLASAYGREKFSFEIDLNSELQTLGFELDPEDKSQANIKTPLKITAFENKAADTLIFCSVGLVNNSLINQKVELIWQVDLAHAEILDCSEQTSLIKLAQRLFTLGWLLLVSAKKDATLIGASISADFSDQKNGVAELAAIMLNKFNTFPNEAICQNGTFRYLNILGITADEYALAQKHSARFLLNALKHKRLDQVSKLKRSSLNWTVSQENFDNSTAITENSTTA